MLYVSVMKFRQALVGSGKHFGHSSIMELFLILSLLEKQWVMDFLYQQLSVPSRSLKVIKNEMFNILVHTAAILWL